MVNKEDFFYPNTCVIRRTTGQTDEDGNEIFDIIYSGKCGLQYGGNGNVYYQGMSYQTSPLIIIPPVIKVLTNDSVEVVDSMGITTLFTVEIPEGVVNDVVGGTTIWLKNGKVYSAE